MGMFDYIKKALSAEPERPETGEDEAELIAPFKAGALYSVYNGDANGQYGVVKILAVEPPAVHLRVFKENFSQRPNTIKDSQMGAGEQATLGGALKQLFASQSYGIAHLPVHVRDFVHGWKPEYMADSPVSEGDLVEYHKWKANNGKS